MPYELVGALLAVAYCLTVHEYAHAKRALLAGDLTPKFAGRVTLNPLAHFDPIGSTMFLLFGFGWAKPVPVNSYNFKRPRTDDIMVSLWGPLSNFISAGVFIALLRLGIAPFGTVFDYFLVYAAILNVLLGVFNLIPIPPLDGSHILAGLLPYQQARRYAQTMGQFGMVFLILLIMPLFGGSSLIGFILSPVMSLVYKLIG
jgi:Zn-dependent protease